MKRDFSLLAGKQFDLLVCGGGIYGAWIAYDAALRGLKVAVVEQGDWASATSSASSKLIHGGLRYLESFDFKLVKKALNERRMLLAAAPHRVWPLRFGVPVYADSRVGALQMKAGLTIYDFLASSLISASAHHHFNRNAFSQRFPRLNTSGLKSGFTYSDAQTDDARLVLELISGAMSAGAVCVNYCRLTDFIETDGRAYGATVHDQISNMHQAIQARQIISATGQWTAAAGEGKGWCRLTKGIHLVMPAVLSDEALLLTAPSDGRVFFMIPWYGVTLLGTTDTDYGGSIDRVEADEKDIDYLLNQANHYLNTAWTRSDIINSYAGLRVLKRSDQAAHPSAVSRDWELKTANNGVHYSIGGKITSAREDAASAVNVACAQLGVRATGTTQGRDFPWAPADYAIWRTNTYARANTLGIDQECAKWLVRRHGKRVDEIFHTIDKDRTLAARIVSELPFIYADLWWSAGNEMVVHLEDLLRRRMPLLILSRLSTDQLQKFSAAVAPILGWDRATIAAEIDACRTGN